MSVTFYATATFVKKNPCLLARVVSFDTAGLHHFPYFRAIKYQAISYL